MRRAGLSASAEHLVSFWHTWTFTIEHWKWTILGQMFTFLCGEQ